MTYLIIYFNKSQFHAFFDPNSRMCGTYLYFIPLVLLRNYMPCIVRLHYHARALLLLFPHGHVQND